MIFGLILLLIGTMSMYFGLIRNTQVYYYRMRLLDQISAASKRDIYAGHDWLWRYKAFDSVSYNEMVLKFWKSPKSFYDMDLTA